MGGGRCSRDVVSRAARIEVKRGVGGDARRPQPLAVPSTARRSRRAPSDRSSRRRPPARSSVNVPPILRLSAFVTASICSRTCGSIAPRGPDDTPRYASSHCWRTTLTRSLTPWMVRSVQATVVVGKELAQLRDDPASEQVRRSCERKRHVGVEALELTRARCAADPERERCCRRLARSARRRASHRSSTLVFRRGVEARGELGVLVDEGAPALDARRPPPAARRPRRAPGT